MSRIFHLPPRGPSTCARDNELHDLIRFPSLGTILEEQPSWLDEILVESDVEPKGTLLRRSASDTAAILDVPVDWDYPACEAGEGNLISTVDNLKPVEIGERGEVCNGLEGVCVYGPNSPRQKSALTNSQVCALMESIPPNKLEYVTIDSPASGAIKQSNPKGACELSAGDLDAEKAARRRSGQRSRVRKLQYIAELERTVEVYQTLGAELAAGVASLFQQRVALYLENKNLRRQIAGLQQEKMIKDGQYLSLKNEAERLKVMHGRQRHRRTKSATSCFDTATVETNPLGSNWQMLDFGKLSLGGSTVHLGHGYSR